MNDYDKIDIILLKMKYKDHLIAYEEHRDTLDWAINRGIIRSQRIIGMHISRGIMELLSAYLHKINLIEIGFQVNHRWFKSKKVLDRFPDFSDKDIIFNHIIQLELQSENLTYGSKKTEEDIKKVLSLFNDIEKILLNKINKENKINESKK